MNDLEKVKQITAGSEQFTPAIMDKLQELGFKESMFMYDNPRTKPGNFWVSKLDSNYNFAIIVKGIQGLRKDNCDVNYLVEGNIFSPPKEKKTVTYSLPESTRMKLNELKWKWRTNKTMSDLVAEGIDDLMKLHEAGKLNVQYAQAYSAPGKVSYSLSLGAFEQLRRLKYETKLNYVDILVKAVDDLYIKYMEAMTNEIK